MSSAHPVSFNSTYEPLVTIAIPTFNRATWLRGCVTSALSQSYQNFEVVVSDNASTDNTQEVLNQFADRRLRVLRQQTTVAILENWNFCLANARGEYIIFLSDDDRISPSMLQRCIEQVNSEPKILTVLTLCDIYSKTDNRINRIAPSEQYKTGVWDGIDLLLECLRGKIPTVTCGIMMRTDALRAHKGFSVELPNFGADMAAWACLLLNGRAGFVNESCATFCIHATSETSLLTLDQRICDEQRFMNFIANSAESTIANPDTRWQVRFEAERWIARRFVSRLTPSSDATVREIMTRVWRWRYNLLRAFVKHPVYVCWLLVITLFPEFITNHIRTFKRNHFDLRSARARRGK
jgi:glycosyltransferase involved in cell wall biosynthesis